MHWEAPIDVGVKINVDTSVLKDQGVRFGVVIHDLHARFWGAAVKRSRIWWSPALAESLVILYGVELGWRMRIEECVVESDCLFTISQLRSGEPEELEV
ncbi:unnamed protein product [Linum trigynum]|uniref:RNase H type-1 domain-containing protein n=1 Tax=Linum trigynum TaxID=586398 RepID=A0AAV2EYC9_9ROSI